MFETEKILSKMKYLVYLTYCITSKKIYVGVHMTDAPDTFDGYLANGVYTNRPATYKRATTPFKRAVQKYGIHAFRRITLAVFDTSEEAYKLEASIVNDEFIRRIDTYNIKLGGSGGCPESFKRKVYMYDSNGEFVQEFETVYACMQFLYPEAPNGSHICRAIKEGTRVKNYQFSYEKVPFMKKWNTLYDGEKLSNAIKNRDTRKVGRFDNEGNLLEIFNSGSDARKHGYKNVHAVLKGIRQKCNGYTFKYIE